MEVWLNMAITQITEVNVITGEIVERQFTEQEKIAHNLFKEETELMATAQAEKDAQKAIILTKLGITADEAKLLLS